MTAWHYDLDETEAPVFCCAKSTACSFTGTAVEMDVHYATAHAPIVLPVSPFAPQGKWVRDAACAVPNIDPTLFDEPDGEDGLTRAERRQRATAAASVCARCPVRAECLADADENGLTGVRGGVLIYDRGTRRRDLLPAAPAAA